VSFTSITLCVASQLVFIIVVVDFVIDSVRKLLDTPSHMDVTGTLHAPVALPTGKNPRYPLDRRLGGPQSRS
jgi:hypothetical protein